jgi:cytochrome c-type biogenesis protein CcmE
MNKIRIKLAVGTCIVLGAIAYLAVAGAKQSLVYHMSVDQFLADGQYRTQRVRLAGTVSTKQFLSDPGNLTASFLLTGKLTNVLVQYHGVIPGLFQAGRDVVIEGQLNTQGVFVADVLMTKCASKYESKLNMPRTNAAPASDSVQALSAGSPTGRAS